MKTYKLLAVFAAILTICTACDHKELCYHHPHIGKVTVVFDWRYAPDANPATMSVYLYPKDGGTEQRYEFTEHNGGVIEVPEGEYVAVCVNSDISYTLINLPSSSAYSASELYKYFEVTSETSSRTSRISTLSNEAANSAPRAEGTENERVAYAPEAVWTDVNTDVVVLNSSDAANQVITLYPQQSFCRYTVVMQNINNIENVTEMSATLSSMAGGVYAYQRTPTEELVTIPFSVAIDRASGGAQSSFNTFGHCPSDAHTHTVLIYAVMNDGAKYYGTVDVTDQVHNGPDPYNVVITIDNVKLPNPVISGGGSVTVEQWENFTVEVPFYTI